MSELTLEQYLADSKLEPMWDEFLGTLDWNATETLDSDKLPAFEKWMIEKAKNPTMTPNGNRFFEMYEHIADSFPAYSERKLVVPQWDESKLDEIHDKLEEQKYGR